jgi:3-hydroxyacyl-CoA dehydrogenase
MSKRLDTIAGHLSVKLLASGNSELVTIQKHAGIAVLTIRNPPVNAFGIHVAEQVAAVLESLLNDKGVLGIVIQGHNSFVAGADIKAMRQSAPPVDSAFRRVFSLLEGASKPIVASITLFALGGGLEIALACSGRVAHDSAQLVCCNLGVSVLCSI